MMVGRPASPYIQLCYDGRDRPLTIINSATEMLSVSYNSKGEMTGRSLIGGVSTALTYDALSRPATMTHDLAGTNGNIAYGYGYNRASQMTSRSRNNDAYIYGGDVNVARSYTVNGLNQSTATSTGAIGRASWREREWPYGEISVVAGHYK